MVHFKNVFYWLLSQTINHLKVDHATHKIGAFQNTNVPFAPLSRSEKNENILIFHIFQIIKPNYSLQFINHRNFDAK